MKKMIAILLTMILAIGCTVGAMAQSATAGKYVSKTESKIQKIEQKQADISSKIQKFTNKKEEYGAFRKQLTEKRIGTLEGRRDNLGLVAENRKLSLELKKSMAAIKEKGIVLSDDVQAQLGELTAKLKTLTTSLKETKGDIKAVTEEYKGFIKAKDYAAMDEAFNKIAAIQTQRNDLLKQIGETLKEMITLLATVA